MLIVTIRTLRDERGVALPMAMFTLVLLTSLSLAFMMLGQSEPTIAGNHRRVAQARALAESGLEKAIWAMTNSTDPNGIPNTTLSAPGSPYDGTVFVAISSQGGYTGGFTLLITNLTNKFNVREVTSVGYAPDNTANTKAKSTVISKIAKLNNLTAAAPCGLCVNGNMDLSGNIQANASTPNDPGPPYKCGGGSKYGAYSSGTIGTGGSADVYGSDGSHNVAGTSYKANQSFDFTFSKTPAGSSDIDALRALAKSQGTYIKAGSTSQTAIESMSSTPPSGPVVGAITNGIVFVDTTDGSNTVTASNKASVDIGPGWSASSPFTGWIIVLGDMNIHGNFGSISGLVYTQGMLSSSGMGASEVRGMAIVENVLGASSFTPGNSKYIYDCTAAQPPSNIPQGWFGQAGTYCEKPGGC